MQNVQSLLGIVAALGVGVITPGPSFVMVARVAVSASRAQGLAAAVGMGMASVLFALTALLGLQALLLAVPSLYLGLKVVGGLYLGYLGLRIWFAASKSLSFQEAVSDPKARLKKSFLMGFTTQISNPKTAVVYASVFAAFLPPVHSAGFNVAVVSAVFVIETGWYSLVALLLSSERPRMAYLDCKTGVDRMAGGIMVGLGAKLLSTARLQG